ncbi:MAG: restriction endonuclease subunit S [Thiothrix sp.]|nr:MAG: restriction endonuclease subunit S [Thiothrix sp.]
MKNNKFVPKLRFRGFEKIADWQILPLGDVAENLDNRRIPITESDRVKGKIPYYGASGIIDYVKEFIFDEEVLCISEDGANLVARTLPIAFSVSGKSWINNHAHVLRFKQRSTQALLENYLNSIKLDDFLTGMAQPKLNRAMLDIIPVPLPKNIEEQQKIADCLSSLDDLVTAHTQKLETLKTYKKGLMQQLFPAEGEIVPKLRFEGFEGDWEETNLKAVSQMQAGKFVSASDIYELKDDNKYPCYGGNGLRGYTETYTHQGKYPLIGRQGALCGNITLANGKFHATEHAITVKPKDKNSIDWLFYTLLKLNLNQYATGQAQPGLSVEVLEKVSLKKPKSIEEQQKVADCLSSVDNLITTQAQKIENLKLHKKGLMQQLFPSNEEVMDE